MNHEVLRTSLKVAGNFRDEIRGTKLKLSLIEGGEERKNKLIALNKYLESKRLELCKDEGIGISDRVEYLLLSASSLDGSMGGRYERNMDKTGVGSYIVDRQSGSQQVAVLRER